MASTAFSSAVGAALMLYAGFGMNLRGVSGAGLYDGSVAAFTWTMKIGGLAMAASAVLLYAGWRPVLPADAVLTAVIGAILAGTGMIWMVNQDVQGVLNLVFALLFLGAARRSWMVFRASSRGTPPPAGSWREEEPIGREQNPPRPSVADRQAAMDRLLAAKRRQPPSEPPPTEPAGAVTKPAEPVVVQQQEAVRPSPGPAASAPADPAPPTAALTDEPAPEGFLAQLGRDE
ncbi:MAG: hypothetical protein HRF43_11680 [Phycisphaerae bacterium]|jgi:hypothetical protein